VICCASNASLIYVWLVELRHLRYFVAVAEELHFGRAAQRLHIVQPALSKQIMALERDLGVQLFERTKRSVRVTSAGEALYDEARAILQRVERAAYTAQMTAIGEIGGLDIGFIGPAMWSVIPPTLRVHRQRFPGVRFHLHELGSAAQMRRLGDGGLDVGFVRPPVNEARVVFQTVLQEPFVVGLPEDHPYASAEILDLAELASETFILVPRRESPGFYDRCVALCHTYGFSPRAIEEGNAPAAMYGMVAAGLGVTLAPASVLNVPWHGVVFRPLDRPSLVELAVAHRDEDPSAALAAFLETLFSVVASATASNVAVALAAG
jgi:DNA-binding transcriptional LysR family regulator